MAENKIIPLIPDYSYDVNTILEGLNVQFQNVRWNFTDNAWYTNLIIFEADITINGIKLVGGDDLLRQYAITELGKLFMVDVENKFEDPNFEQIGDRFKLLYILKENVNDFPF